jgi:hypothetical protein
MVVRNRTSLNNNQILLKRQQYEKTSNFSKSKKLVMAKIFVNISTRDYHNSKTLKKRKFEA